MMKKCHEYCEIILKSSFGKNIHKVRELVIIGKHNWRFMSRLCSRKILESDVTVFRKKKKRNKNSTQLDRHNDDDHYGLTSNDDFILV